MRGFYVMKLMMACTVADNGLKNIMFDCVCENVLWKTMNMPLLGAYHLLTSCVCFLKWPPDCLTHT